jgi:hypothetical protein
LFGNKPTTFTSSAVAPVETSRPMAIEAMRWRRFIMDAVERSVIFFGSPSESEVGIVPG